jgi:hypothetical protein
MSRVIENCCRNGNYPCLTWEFATKSNAVTVSAATANIGGNEICAFRGDGSQSALFKSQHENVSFTLEICS